MKLFTWPIVDRVLRRVGPYFAALYLHLVGRTQRLKVEGRDYYLELARGNGPFIFALWHSRLLVPAHLYRGFRVGALVSTSRDGEYIARTIDRLGLVALRGSSFRGATAGFLRLARHLKGGHSIAVTPDGPRGPREQVQPGIIQLAKVSGIPIIPVAYSPARRITLNSWDRFLIPLPFCRAAMVYREPIVVSRHAGQDDMEILRLRLENELSAATRRAEEIVGKRSEIE